MPADDRVLILDMRAAERSRLAAALSRLGYRATFADTLAAAQALGMQQAFPNTIVDLQGQHLELAELQMQLSGSAIIAVGARSLAAALAAWQAGADSYLPRPVRDAELASALEQTARARAAHAAKLTEARIDLAALSEFRGLAAELARQINTPLAPVLGLADLLVEVLPPHHPGHEYAQAIAAAALRIRDITWMLADTTLHSE
jgi:DNA-binding response OmpR family regulator